MTQEAWVISLPNFLMGREIDCQVYPVRMLLIADFNTM